MHGKGEMTTMKLFYLSIQIAIRKAVSCPWSTNAGKLADFFSPPTIMAIEVLCVLVKFNETFKVFCGLQ